MTNMELLTKMNTQKIGKIPVVVLPLKVWQEIEERLEEGELLGKFWKSIDKERAQYKAGKFIAYNL